MGINYYLHDETDVCSQCGHNPREPWHIGKSSRGWCFALHVYPEAWEAGKPTNLAEWQAEWAKPHRVIRNEDGEVISPEEMLACITQRAGTPDDGTRFPQPYAAPGPNHLKRCTHRTSIPPDNGTYDLVTGEFS